jgi:myo-inositol-1(or 4)-monophosphatase
LSSQRDSSLQDALLDASVHAAREAADYIRLRGRDLASIDWIAKSRADFVSEVDLGAESRITDLLMARFPDALVLGEELTPTATTADGIVFVVDPLDGTTNFLHGYPEYAVSIGALVGGELTAAVVLEIPRGTTYTAAAGRGAYRDGERLTVSTIADPIRALIGTGFPFKQPEQIAPYLPQLARVIAETAGVRRAGSAALELAHVASGHFDAFWELMLAPWDIAAGILLVREAGGRVTDLEGRDATPAHTPLVASNGALHDWLLARIRG